MFWFSQSWPIRVLSWWLERGIPKREGFGKFRATERFFDIADLEESTHVLDRTDRRFFIQPNDTPAEAWWHEEIRMLRMLDNQAACARLRSAEKERDERYLTRLVVTCVAVVSAGFAFAVYAMRYLK
jgi:hypothetical protein